MKLPYRTRAALWLLLFLQFSYYSTAQTSIAAFLASASQDPRMQIYSDQISYLNRNPYRLSPVRQLEFRLQNSELYAAQHEYALRLSPANPWELRNTSRYFKSYQAVLGLEREMELKEALYKRYQLVVEFLYHSNMERIKQQQLENVRTQLSVLEQQSGSGFFKEDDFVELTLELYEEQSALESVSFEKSRSTAEINNLYPAGNSATAAWRYDVVLSADRLEQLADSLMQQPLYTTRLAYRKERIRLADREYALERSNVNPGFLQSEYMPYRQSRGQYGFSLGVRLPIFNPNRGDMAEKKLEVLEANSDLAMEELSAREEVERLYSALKANLTRYRGLEQSMLNSRLTEMSETVGVLNSNNPMLKLKLNARQLKLQRIRAQILNDVYRSYLELLYASDLLVLRPLHNYLSPGLEPL